MTVRLLEHFSPATPPELPGGEVLTARETDVVRLVALGKTNAEIAAALHIAAGTVKNHIASIHRKLGTRNRVGIASWGWETGTASR